jgi:hypothetical protein
MACCHNTIDCEKVELSSTFTRGRPTLLMDLRNLTIRGLLDLDRFFFFVGVVLGLFTLLFSFGHTQRDIDRVD